MRSERFDVVLYAPWAASLLSYSELPAGGAETQLVAFGSGLAGRGLRVGLMIAKTSARLPREYRGMTVLVRRIPRGHGSLMLRALHGAATALAVARVRAAVVVQRSAGPTTAIVGAIARARGARFVYSSANVIDFDFGRLERRRSNVRLYEWGVRHADQVVVQTEEQVALCRERFGRDPILIRSVAAVPVEPPAPSGEAFLWVGRLVDYKRLDVYVDLAAAVPDARFQALVVVPPEADPSLQSLLARAREQPNLELVEPRPHEDLMRLVGRAVAIVNTSDYEGMSNVLLEGFARGIPALAFSHDPDGVVERHGLGAFAGGEREALADQARSLWAGRGDSEALAARCREYVRRVHDPEVVVDRWIDALMLRERVPR